MKFTTIKQVKLAVWSQRHSLIQKYTEGKGSGAAIYYEKADGNYGRIYHLSIAIPNYDGSYTFVKPFEELSDWVQGGLSKSELLEWASQNLS